jgi:hypothetical protein
MGPLVFAHACIHTGLKGGVATLPGRTAGQKRHGQLRSQWRSRPRPLSRALTDRDKQAAARDGDRLRHTGMGDPTWSAPCVSVAPFHQPSGLLKPVPKVGVLDANSKTSIYGPLLLVNSFWD